MSFRPKDWEKTLQETISIMEFGKGMPLSNLCFEAGADAMLEALLTKGLKVNNINMKEHLGKGTVIFIPDVEE